MKKRDQTAIGAFAIGAVAVMYGLYVASAYIANLIGIPTSAIFLVVIGLVVWQAVRVLNKAVGKEDPNEW